MNFIIPILPFPSIFKIMGHFLRFNWFPVCWAIAILIICLMPGKDLPPVHIFQFDKLIHLLIYSILAYTMHSGWRRQTQFLSLHRFTLLKILLLTSAYGFIVEVLQDSVTSDRQFDLYDALANTLGSFWGVVLARLAGMKKDKNDKKHE